MATCGNHLPILVLGPRLIDFLVEKAVVELDETRSDRDIERQALFAIIDRRMIRPLDSAKESTNLADRAVEPIPIGDIVREGDELLAWAPGRISIKRVEHEIAQSWRRISDRVVTEVQEVTSNQILKEVILQDDKNGINRSVGAEDNAACAAKLLRR